VGVFRTKRSEKLFKKLIRRYSNEGENDSLIKEIVDNHRALEVRAIYNKRKMIDPELVKEQKKEDGKDYSDEAVEKSIKKVIYDCNRSYKNRKKLIKINLSDNSPFSAEEVKHFFDQIVLDKWMNFFAILDIKSTHGKSIEEVMKLPTNIMNDKMFQLFLRVKGIVRV